MLYLGLAGSTEEELARRSGLSFRPIESGQVRGMAPWIAARSLGKVVRGASQAGRVMAEFRPDVVLITGGFVTAPVAWASWRAGVPVLVYLPDIAPGMAIRWLSRLARRVAVSFPEVKAFFPGKAVVTGYPVRTAFWTADRAQARRWLGIDDHEPTVLVFGGSRGARSINRALAAALPELLPGCHVVHISGLADWPQVQEQARALPAAHRDRYHVYPYLHAEMPLAMAAADLGVARAGASTLGEFPAAGLPSILVPYPYAGQHQVDNARYLAQRGAALMLADEDMPTRLAGLITELLHSPERLAQMAEAARTLARPDASANIAGELQHLAMGGM